MSESVRVLALFRHPTPYRDGLLDRVASLPGIVLEVLYLHEGFPQTPWAREPLQHAHRFPRRWFTHERGGHEVAIHPGVVARLITFRPDAVLLPAWSDPSVLLVGFACRLLGIPYILAAESFFETGLSRMAPGLRQWLRAWMVRGAKAWLPTGSRCRDWLVEIGADPARCHFFPTAPDVRRWAAEIDRLRSTRPRLREELGFPAAGVVVFVGRLVLDKAPEILLAAHGLLRERGVTCKLVIVGDGPERPALEAHPAAPGVTFLGFLQPPEVARILAASDVFVLPSRYETWGAVAAEAMAAGLPAILSERVGCAPELAADGVAGEIVPVEDARALADAIARMLGRDDLKSRVASAARARSFEWGHDLNLRSMAQALQDLDLPLDSRVLVLAATGAAPTSDPAGAST